MRFKFGKNWKKFIFSLEDWQIKSAEDSLKNMLDVSSLGSLRFLDVGCGSGIFSLAAQRLGVASVTSFDIDEENIECALTLKKKFLPDSDWIISKGSVLDMGFLNSLGQFDIVYSWGVLHHTGQMYQALENVVPLVKRGGKLFIAIYNDQGIFSYIWKKIKRFYLILPDWLKPVYVFSIMVILEAKHCLKNLFKKGNPFYDLKATYRNRGMNKWRDWEDWVGGYPFEVAKPDEITKFYENKGFVVERLETCGKGLGNNEFVFRLTDIKES